MSRKTEKKREERWRKRDRDVQQTHSILQAMAEESKTVDRILVRMFPKAIRRW